MPLCTPLYRCQSVQQGVLSPGQLNKPNSMDFCPDAAGAGLKSQDPHFFDDFQKVEGLKQSHFTSYQVNTVFQDVKPDHQNSFSVFGMNPITSACQMWAQDLREGRIKS